ncbi:hypothetical protein HOLleu_40452 [Holothuria leucospilota]|uniref:Uncharacterized protein n=1 Tax=Holothuria leucospilota TaxID=206669 RepID=A0A9Q0YI98_HOLLE|nr:hypothetical protein HOLleu_40452 [Holothuria leucospilota]
MKELENSLLLRNLSRTRWTAGVESTRAVWVSYKGIVDVLKELSQSSQEETLTRSKAHGLLTKILRFDFIFSTMFKNIIWKTKVMTEQMQAEPLNILDALVILEGTISSLKTVMKNEEEMTELIQAADAYAKKNDVDAEREFFQIS